MSLQNKVIALVLAPLLLITVALVTAASLERANDTQAQLDQQREALIASRKSAVKNVVETARSAVAPIVEQAGRGDAQAKLRALEILRSIDFGGGNYVFVIEYEGLNLATRPSPEQEGTNMLNATDPDGKPLIRDMIKIAKQGGGFYEYVWNHPVTGDMEAKFSYATGIDKWNWMIGAGVYVTDINAAMVDAEAQATSELRGSIIKASTLGGGIFLLVAVVVTFLARRTIQPIHHTAEAMKGIANGQGDLTLRLDDQRGDELGELAAQFNAFVARMQATLQDVRASTHSVSQASSEIAQGSDELSSRTEQAAANLQETSASMEEISSTVSHSADSAQQADVLVRSTSDVARQGQTAMGQVEQTMADINASSAKIADIITIMDGIAFQTNILALNASVEAARAGDQGRGFAVVAQEVRTLASRSSDAANDIRALIDTSVSHAQSGSELVRSAGETMSEIVSSVERVTDVIAEISAGTKEQSSGIGQINTAISEMDTMTQQNAAMVQQSASAANHMSQHAQRLTRLIGTFVLDETRDEQPTPVSSSYEMALPSRQVLDMSNPPAPKRQYQHQHQEEAEWETF